MKKIKILLLFVISVLLSQEALAQNNTQSDSMMRYYNRLARSANENDRAIVEAYSYKLLQSKEENDWITAQRFFSQLKKLNVADSISREMKLKFPLGQLARQQQTDTIYKEKDPIKKESLYLAWVKKFPPEKFGTERIIYDYVRNSVATAFAEAGDVKKALLYANMVETQVWKGEGFASIATVLARKGHEKEAIELFRKARDNSYKFMTTNRNDYGAGFAISGFSSYSNSLANLLIKENRYQEALDYIKLAHDSARTVRADINSTYSKVLMAMNRNQEAFHIIDEAMKAGQGTNEMKESLKNLYVKVKGSNEGYDEYMASISKILAEKIRKDLARQIINEPAPNFVLKDVDGNTVKLEEFKGKTVILDFWATWCVPCKRSFPAMKMAVEKFKDNPDVKFLFIHTWEREATAPVEAKKYVTDNKFPFHVLMDLKDPEGVNKVVESYKVSAIPTKFVIDKNGNIRFKFTGAAGGDDVVVEELLAMVELANG